MHLLGQHTIRMSPISTAHLNPNGQTFCLAPPGNTVLIPILLNNTSPFNVKYTLTPLGYTEDGGQGKVERVELTAKDLKAIEQSRVEALQLTRPSVSTKHQSDDYDEYDDDEEDESAEEHDPHSGLQKTQSLVHIPISNPGTIRLEGVLDTSNIDARIAYPAELTVVPCPHIEFAEPVETRAAGEDVRCSGQDLDLELLIDIHGVPPLSLKWFKAVNGRREHFLVEGIDGGHHHDHKVPLGSHSEVVSGNGRGESERRKDLPLELKVPLVVSLYSLGTHLYALEEVRDGLGNTVHVGSDISIDSRKHGLSEDNNLSSHSKTTRSLIVLRRPTISFRDCGPGNPTPLLIGSEAPLSISANNVDAFDAPWEVTLKYQPIDDSDKGGTGIKRFKPWKKVIKTQRDNRELSVRANAPGEYTIVGVKGKARRIFSLAHQSG